MIFSMGVDSKTQPSPDADVLATSLTVFFQPDVAFWTLF